MEFCCQRCGVSLAFSLDDPTGDVEQRRTSRRRSRGRPRPAGEDEALPALQPLLPRPPSGAGAPPPPPLGPRRRPSHVGASVAGNASLLDGSFLVLDAALRGAGSRVEGGDGRWDARPGDGWGRRDGDAAGSGARDDERASRWGIEWNAGDDDEESDEEDDEAEGEGDGNEARRAEATGGALPRSATSPGGATPRGAGASADESSLGAAVAPGGTADGCDMAGAGRPASRRARPGTALPLASDVAGDFSAAQRRSRPDIFPATQPSAPVAPGPARAGASLSSPSRPPAPTPPRSGPIASPLPASAPVRIEALVSAMDAASGATGVDHPLCGRCARCVRERLRERIRVAREETEAYERALRELGVAVSDDDDDSDGEVGAGVGTGAGREAADVGARGAPASPGKADAGDAAVPPPLSPRPSPAAAASPSAPPPASSSPPSRSPPSSRPSSPHGSSSGSSAGSAPDSPRAPGAPPAALEEAQRALAAARRSLSRAAEERRALRRASESLGALERRYLLDLNAYELSLEAHLEDRESLSRGIARAAATLAALRKTDVFSDALRIWFDGPFGTIAGLRLGRTSSVPVSWAEINAAWGAAVLLLAALRRECHAPPDPSGTRLLPMGSCPRVADARGTCELYGPVAKLFCPGYDRAQVAFLSSLAHFASWIDHERGRRKEAKAGADRGRPGEGAGRDGADVSREGPRGPASGSCDDARQAPRGYQDPARPQREGLTGKADAGPAGLGQRHLLGGAAEGQRAPSAGQPGASSAQPQASAAPVHFALPWPIEGDRVGSYSIRYGLAKDKTWTRALKCMLVDLKVCVKVAREHLDQER